jgi:hypothetical protein
MLAIKDELVISLFNKPSISAEPRESKPKHRVLDTYKSMREDQAQQSIPMKRALVVPVLLLTFNFAVALPAFDPFDSAISTGGNFYAIGLGLAPNISTNSDGTVNNWALVNTNVVQPLITEGNLAYAGLPASTGNSVAGSPPASGTAASARLNLNVPTGPPTIYYSFILKVTDLTGVPAINANNGIAAFSDSTGAQAPAITRMGGRLVTKTSGSGYLLGVGKGTTLSDYVYDTVERGLGEEVFVVVAYERPGGATNVSLWVNPPESSFGSITRPEPTASVPQGVSAGDLNSNGARAFVLSCQFVGGPSWVIDDVRIATTWADATGGNPSIPVDIDLDPASRNVRLGDRVGFAVAASGSALAYQWRFNGEDIPGATNLSHPIPSAQLSDVGLYTVVVSNSVNVLTSAPAALTVSSTSLPLYETNLIVVRVGDGVQTLATTGNSVFLDQYTTSGAYVNTVFIPDSGPSAVVESGPDLAGSVITGTAITRSADKRLMVLSGYKTNLANPTPLHNTTSVDVPRAIVTINSSGESVLALEETNVYSGAHFRAAASDGTNNFWGAASREGTWYLGLNEPAVLLENFYANTRSVDTFNGNLYSLASASLYNGLLKFGGMPTTAGGGTALILSEFNSVNVTDFVIGPGDELIYLTVASSVQRWKYDPSLMLWTNAYALTAGLNEPTRYITGDFSGPDPVIYATTGPAADGMNRIVRIVDTNDLASAVTLVRAGPNQLFKGIRFGPVAAPGRPLLLFAAQGSDLVLSWSGSFRLVSATNVAGPYVEVPDATSPYTNSTVSTAAQFFGLSQN